MICFDKVGTNYKLSDILSSIGLEQLKNIEILLNRRRELAKNYSRLFSDMNSIIIPEVTKNGLHSYQSYCILIENRDAILKNLRKEGIEVQIGTYSLHMHPAYQNKKLFTIKGSMSGSKYSHSHCLALPLFHEMISEQQEYIVNRLSRNI
jgi:dTDP-4-amino-4,6-dideoxygalactose transaminase